MIYRVDGKGNRVSQLGYGCMRFTRKGGAIDLDKAEREILLAVKHGVNYFDTAYIYPGSEEALGKILERNNLRDKVLIATKLPQYLVRSIKTADKIFEEELSRLRTDYVDFYLMHMFTDYAEWENLKALGIEDWIAKQKAAGRIRNIGFSYHGDTDMFLKILNAYPWDFCQIQYNYMDEHSQAGRRGLKAAEKKGIPVVIMEPLRGGKLCNPPQKAKKLLEKSPYTPAELGLRWLFDQHGILCVLSGMNSEEMVLENVRIASRAMPGSFTDTDRALVDEVRGIIREKEKVGCTGCRYCMPCPMGVDIPANFFYYNMMYTDNKATARMKFAQNVCIRKKPGLATQCVNCGRCERHCPQKLPIRQKLREADKALRPPLYRLAENFAGKFIVH